MNRSYSKIRHIQESNLKLEKRMLIENQSVNHSVEFQGDDDLMTITNADNETVREHLIKFYNKTRFIHLIDCEFVDFSGIDLCSSPNLIFIHLQRTDSNFQEQGYECAKEIGKNMYDMKFEEEPPKKKRFSDPIASTNMYGDFKYSYKK
jgi:hypothetical protein